jgi:hypothetical protein
MVRAARGSLRYPAIARYDRRSRTCDMAKNYWLNQADSVRLFLFLRGFVKNPALPALRVETGDPGKRTKWPRNGYSKGDRQDRDENDDYV